MKNACRLRRANCISAASCEGGAERLAASMASVVATSSDTTDVRSCSTSAACLAHRADARVALVRLVEVEADGDRFDALADRHRQLARPLHRHAILRDVEERADLAGDEHLAAQRVQIGGAVALRPEEDLTD